MVEFKERLQLAMNYSKASREAPRAALDVSRVAIDKLLDGRSKSMSAENCAYAAQFLGVDLFWLATGVGEMTPSQNQHAAAESIATYTINQPNPWPMQTVSLHEYNSLSERQQGHIEGQIRAMLDAKNQHGSS